MKGETVTVLRAGSTTDAYGDPAFDWATPVEIPHPGSAVAPRLEDEDRRNGREGIVTGWTVYFPPGADVRGTDRVRIRGLVYRVDGQPAQWTNPYSTKDRGTVIHAGEVEG
jgi:hypothetical protein